MKGIRPTREQLIKLAKERPEDMADLVLSLFDKIEQLEERIASLERKCGNSSKPPSSDKGNFANPKLKPKSQRKRSGKKSGGQPGHKGSHLSKTENPDHIVKHVLPDQVECPQCPQCQKMSKVKVSGHQTRQVFDIPPMQLEVTEHQAQQCQCGHCSATITATFPPEVKAPTQYGDRIKSFCIYLSTYQLLPYKRLTECMEDLFNAPISQGTLRNFIVSAGAQASEAIKPIKEALIKANVLHSDETGL